MRVADSMERNLSLQAEIRRVRKQLEANGHKLDDIQAQADEIQKQRKKNVDIRQD